MGRTQAEEMASLTDQDTALRWHLQHNHFPPVNLVFLDTAKEAISLANQRDWDVQLTMPNNRRLTVSAIVQGLHLDSFLDSFLGEDDDDQGY